MNRPASERTSGTAAGVPFVAIPPAAGPRASAPVVLAWHLLDPPRSEVVPPRARVARAAREAPARAPPPPERPRARPASGRRPRSRAASAHRTHPPACASRKAGGRGRSARRRVPPAAAAPRRRHRRAALDAIVREARTMAEVRALGLRERVLAEASQRGGGALGGRQAWDAECGCAQGGLGPARAAGLASGWAPR
jgi:hypothetical protein